MPRVLHVLSQRPSLTGSGITLDALVRRAAEAGWEQRVLVGLPATSGRLAVGGLDPGAVDPLQFGHGRLDFPLPGMSDVMPYRTSRFRELTPQRLGVYGDAWREHLDRAVRDFRPHVIHTHHVWLVSSLVKDVAPGVPVVTHCHATGLRQMQLCPHLADDVRRGCSRNERFLALHERDAREIARRLDVEAGRVHVVGAGYREELFHARGRRCVEPPRIAFVGKYSEAKGLPWLLDAFEGLLARQADRAELHVVGSGTGSRAAELLERMRALEPSVRLHGTLSQSRLAELLRTCRVFVLPSFYEGLPLVVIEALACGCRPVVTDLPGVREELAPHLGSELIRVPLPPLDGVDTPAAAGLPAFVESLREALAEALDRPPVPESAPEALGRFRWRAVFDRVERIWRDLIRDRA